jgi:curli biogenesis system outer membrane secretion channel CsgG
LVTYWFHNNINIGEGIRAMLTVRMAQSKTVTLLERKKINNIMKEQDFGASNRVKKGTNAKIGQITGADAMLYGDIVIFGRDDSKSGNKLSGVIRKFSPTGAAIAEMKKTDKAVVGINLRIVDAETGEVIDTAEARGESSRTSMDVGGVIGINGVTIGGASDMTSSNFQQTIIGEATSNAVTNIVNFLESRVPGYSAKARQIEGRVATITAGGALLNVGGDDSVMRGDRFEILKINGEIKDPATKEVIDVDAVKIGELVIDTVRDKTASGAYGGQPLSATYMTASGKGYAARLMTK